MYQKQDLISYLRRVSDAKKRLRTLQEELKDLRDDAECVSAVQYTDRIQTSNISDSVGSATVKILEKQEEITKEIDNCIDVRLKIADEILNLDDVMHIKILHKRYVLCKKWEEIAREVSFDERQLMRHHNKALEEFFNKNKRCP